MELRKSLELYFRTNGGTRLFETAQSVWDYWIAERGSMPELAAVVLSMLSVPTSSAPVERSFKQVQTIGFDVKRQRLDPNKASNIHKIRYNGPNLSAQFHHTFSCPNERSCEIWSPSLPPSLLLPPPISPSYLYFYFLTPRLIFSASLHLKKRMGGYVSSSKK